MSDASALPSTATCAVHPEAPATFACPRCGTFSCEACRGSVNRALCADCERRLGQNIQKVGIGEALAGGFRLTWQRLPHLAVFAAVALGPPLLVYALLKWSLGEVPSLAQVVKRWSEAQTHDPAALMRDLRQALPTLGVSWGAGLIGWVATVWGQSFLQRSCVTFPDAMPERIKRSARITSERFARALAVDLVSIVAVYVGFALCCLPGVAVAVVTYAVDAAVLLKDRSISAAFNDSFRTARRNIPALLVLIVGIVGLGFALNFLASKVPRSTLDPQLVEELLLCANRLLVVPLSLGTVYVYLRAGPPEAGSQPSAQ